MVSLGPQALAIRELLEVVIGKGSGRFSLSSISGSLLAKYGTLQRMDCAGLAELCEVGGLGRAKALQLQAAIEIGKRFSLEKEARLSGSVLTTDDAGRLAKCYLKNKKKEHVMLFCLDARGRLIDVPETVSIGTLDCSLLSPREIFRTAIASHASKILMAHNHPSGSCDPSDADLEATRHVYRAGEAVGINLVDHIVLGSDSFTSIRQVDPGIFS